MFRNAIYIIVKAIQTKIEDGTIGLEALKDLVLAIPTMTDISDGAETYVHPNVTTEQTVKEWAADGRFILDAQLDLTNLTKGADVWVEKKIDGVTYRELVYSRIPWQTTDPDGVELLGILCIDQDVRIRIQSGAAEGATRDIEVTWMKDKKEQ